MTRRHPGSLIPVNLPMRNMTPRSYWFTWRMTTTATTIAIRRSISISIYLQYTQLNELFHSNRVEILSIHKHFFFMKTYLFVTEFCVKCNRRFLGLGDI